MPEICRFGGMVIVMLFKDIQHHNKPHIHVYYGDYEASIGLDGEMLAGSLPAKQFKMLSAGYYSTKKSFIKLGILPFKGNILIKSNRCKEGCLCLQKMALFMHRSHAKSCA